MIGIQEEEIYKKGWAYGFWPKIFIATFDNVTTQTLLEIKLSKKIVHKLKSFQSRLALPLLTSALPNITSYSSQDASFIHTYLPSFPEESGFLLILSSL